MLTVTYFACAALLIFVTPYYVPMKYVVFSYSYDFGFNNRIAFLGALVSVLAAPFFLERDAERPRMIPVPQRDPRFSRKPLYLMMVLHAMGIAFYYLVTLVDGRSSDGSYFLSHAINMAHGFRPYKDFEFAYGPALLYPTHWLTMAGLSVHAAYFLFYFAVTVAGLYLAWSFANLLPIRTSLKTLVFLLICGISIVSLTTVGVSYAIVRFVTPLWILGKLNEANVWGRPVWKQALIVCAGILMADLISPEIGTVLCVTASAFFGFTCFRDREARSLRLAAAIACVGIHCVFFFILMPPGFRSSMVAFGHGGLNYPVVPSLLDTLYLLCFAYCFKRHVSTLRQQDLIFPLILLFAIGSMAGALTHADTGHVAWDGLGVFVLAVVADGSKPNLRRRFLAMCPAFLFALGIPYLPQAQQLRVAGRGANSLIPTTRCEALAVGVGHVLHFNPARVVQRIQSSSLTIAEERDIIDREAAAVAAYPSSVAPMYIDYRLQDKLAGINLKPSYYFQLVNVFSPDVVAQKIDYLRSAQPAVLVMPDEGIDMGGSGEAEEQKTMRKWLSYPYYVHRKNDSWQIYEPLFAYIRQNYTQMPTNKAIWVNNAFLSSNYTDPAR